ncbi:hypothetical protein HPT29_015620 [Microvirga terrae]|uniref:Histidine kinase n=1 Tax=Microvirga terrae TaxID=2740529 RepID=A0ABY5RNN2_9HYPH|nr:MULTISPECIES: hypothetical protein [Microvirga]MBQ0823839.1 hypothetical protein [Microvirga sp. HBU67558]UVF17944.1 hypothetical protein HPT29_015620 [Microvirga terrae]
MSTKHSENAGTSWREIRLIIVLGTLIGITFGFVTYVLTPEPLIVVAKSKSRP